MPSNDITKTTEVEYEFVPGDAPGVIPANLKEGADDSIVFVPKAEAEIPALDSSGNIPFDAEEATIQVIVAEEQKDEATPHTEQDAGISIEDGTIEVLGAAAGSQEQSEMVANEFDNPVLLVGSEEPAPAPVAADEKTTVQAEATVSDDDDDEFFFTSTVKAEGVVQANTTESENKETPVSMTVAPVAADEKATAQPETTAGSFVFEPIADTTKTINIPKEFSCQEMIQTFQTFQGAKVITEVQINANPSLGALYKNEEFSTAWEQFLQKNTHITNVQLSKNYFSPTNAADSRLISALSRCQSLEYLDLSDNLFGQSQKEVVYFIAFLEDYQAIIANKYKICINLSNNFFGPDGILPLLKKTAVTRSMSHAGTLTLILDKNSFASDSLADAEKEKKVEVITALHNLLLQDSKIIIHVRGCKGLSDQHIAFLEALADVKEKGTEECQAQLFNTVKTYLQQEYPHIERVLTGQVDLSRHSDIRKELALLKSAETLADMELHLRNITKLVPRFAVNVIKEINTIANAIKIAENNLAPAVFQRKFESVAVIQANLVRAKKAEDPLAHASMPARQRRKQEMAMMLPAGQDPGPKQSESDKKPVVDLPRSRHQQVI